MPTVTVLSPCGHISLDVWPGEPSLQDLETLAGGPLRLVADLTSREGSACVAWATFDGALNELATEVRQACTPGAASVFGVAVLVEP